MAIRSLRSAKRHFTVWGKLSPFFLQNNCALAGFYSTAAQKHSAGDECHGDDFHIDDFHVDDITDDQCDTLSDVRLLEMRNNRLEKKVQELTERCHKALADSEMVRRRTQKFVEDAKLFGIQSFCRDLVEVADILEQQTSGTTCGICKQDGERGSCEGLNKVQDRLQVVFAKHGLEKMTPVGGVYDPYEHEVVCHIPAVGINPGSVAVVKQEGYKLHGRTIRHARVCIAVETQDQ